MSRVSRYATAAPEASSSLLSPPSTPDDEQDVIFNQAEQQLISRLKEESLATRIAIYYHAKHKVRCPLHGREFSSLTSEEFLELVQTFTTFGSKRWFSATMGDVNEKFYEDYKYIPLHVAKGAIVAGKVTAVDSFTDYSLSHHLASLAGTVVELSEDPNEVVLIPAGWNNPVRVSCVAPTIGLVLGGGEAYLAWRRETQDKPFEYLRLSPTIRRIARYFVSRYSISIKEGNFTVNARGALSLNKTLLPLTQPPLKCSRHEHLVIGMLRQAYSRKDVKPSGISFGDTPIEMVGWLLSSEWSHMDPADHSDLETHAANILEYGEACVKAVTNIATAITPFAIATHKAGLLGINAPYTHGALFTYVEGHRSTLRSVPATDLPRKTDAPKLGRIAGEATACAEKIQRAWEATGLEKGGHTLDVYGLDGGWLRGVVREIGDKINWFDLDAKHDKKDGPFAIMDITHLKEGSGKGKILVDNTFVLDPDMKLRIVVSAGYDAFISKMYMGRGSSSSTIQIGDQLPIGLEGALKNYRVKLVDGGGAHSQEYYVVGVRREEPATSEEQSDDALDALDFYVEKTVKAMRQNIFRSAQVWAGCIVQEPEWVEYSEGCKARRVALGGSVGPKAPTVNVVKAGDPAKMTRVSRYAQEGQDPVVKSQLNGVNGEATNSDDVCGGYGNCQWVTSRSAECLKNRLEAMEEELFSLPRQYPVTMAPLMVWEMLPPSYSEGRGIKLGGRKNLANGVMVSNGMYQGHIVMAFYIRIGGPRVCAILHSQRHTGQLQGRRDQASFNEKVLVDYDQYNPCELSQAPLPVSVKEEPHD